MALSAGLEARTDGEGIRFVFTVTNPDTEPVALRFSDASRIDVRVLDGDVERWRFSDGRLFAQVVGEETVGPGDRTAYDVAWTDPDPGEYVAVGELLARNRSCEARTEFAV